MKVICEVSFGNDDKVRVSVVTNTRDFSGISSPRKTH